MYKKQMSLQRIICFLSIAASVVVFIYALGIMTDLFDMLYTMIPDPDDLDSARVAGARIYYDMQGFNQSLLRISIGLILLSVALFITNTHSRRKYYVGNYTAVALNVIANCGVAWWAHNQIIAFRAQFLNTVDFEALERRLRTRPGVFTTSTFWFDIHYAVFAFALLVAVLLIVNTLWKIKLMKDERSLLEAGKAVAA